MNKYWVVQAKRGELQPQGRAKWVNWAGVTAPTKEEALAKAQEHCGFPIRVVRGSAAQDRKFARQAAQAGFAPVSGEPRVIASFGGREICNLVVARQPRAEIDHEQVYAVHNLGRRNKWN